MFLRAFLLFVHLLYVAQFNLFCKYFVFILLLNNFLYSLFSKFNKIIFVFILVYLIHVNDFKVIFLNRNFFIFEFLDHLKENQFHFQVLVIFLFDLC